MSYLKNTEKSKRLYYYDLRYIDKTSIIHQQKYANNYYTVRVTCIEIFDVQFYLERLPLLQKSI